MALVTSTVADRSVLAEFVVDADDFALGRTLGRHPDVTVRLEQVVPLGESVVPYLWVDDEDSDHVVEAIRSDPGVERVEVVDAVDSRALVRTEWTDDGDGLVAGVSAVGAQVLEGVGGGDEWRLELRFPSHEALAAFHRECTDRGVSLTLRSVMSRAVPDERTLESSLTEVQRRTMRAALEAGYFSVPREATLEDLAAEMGVSDTAVSQRLRRGLSTLVGATLDATLPGAGPWDDDAEADGGRAAPDDERADEPP